MYENLISAARPTKGKRGDLGRITITTTSVEMTQFLTACESAGVEPKKLLQGFMADFVANMVR